ncbi:MAG: hypothetical protein IJ542_00435 [Clostridia bacterium]|nr:hypothetical protein [Clostridia bacterium]
MEELDDRLKYYLVSLGFKPEDIENLISVCPALVDIDFDFAFDNISEVVKRGFPIEDIDAIIAVNPTFLTADKQTLITDLNAISGDIEQALKDDPFLI